MRTHLIYFMFLPSAVALLNACSSETVSSSSSSSSYFSSTTIAGTHMTAGAVDAKGTQAKFNGPSGGVVVSGNIYVADSLNNVIRRVTIATGVVTTIAGTAGITGDDNGTGTAAEFNYPEAVTSDGTNLYVTDSGNHLIRKIVIASKVVTTLAGSTGVAGSTDATGTAATFDTPTGITSDGANLYVGDLGNNVIRQIVIGTGVVTTLAGTAGVTGDNDGTGAAAEFDTPRHLIRDSGNLYVVDGGNSTIRKIVISTGVVTTFAGGSGVTGDTDATGTAARFNSPYAIAIDDDQDYLYVTDSVRSTIRKIDIGTAVVTTLAGLAGTTDYEDDTGTDALFFNPRGIVVKSTSVYVMDTQNNSVRKIVVSTGVTTTLAGTGPSTGSANGTGTAASFDEITGVATDGTDLYVTDTDNNTIRKVSSAGVVTTIAGTAGVTGSTDATSTAASFSAPKGIVYVSGILYIADSGNHTIRKLVISTGVVTTLAGGAGVAGTTNATGTAARFDAPYGITSDGTNLFVTSDHAVRKIVISTTVVTSLAGTSGTSGTTDATGTAARFNGPRGLANDGTNLYVCDYTNHTIRKVVIATGVVTTLAGTATTAGFIDDTGAAARFRNPTDVVTDGSSLYVVDNGNTAIRVIDISTGAASTLAGTYNADAVDGDRDGYLGLVRFNDPMGIAYTTDGLYISNDNGIRLIY